MSPDDSRASYRRQTEANGRTATFHRPSKTGTAPFETEVRLVRVRGYNATEILAGMDVGARMIIIEAAEVERAGITMPFIKGSDAFIVGGDKLFVNGVDDEKRRIGDVLIAYEIEAKGR